MEGKCVVARAHPESDSATDAGTNRCPQGVPKMSQIRSVGSGNVLHNANHLTVLEVDAIVSFKASFGLQCSTRRDKNFHILTFCEFSQACNELCTHETYHHDPQPLPVNFITITWRHMTPTWHNVLIYKRSFRKTLGRLLQQYLELRSRT